MTALPDTHRAPRPPLSAGRRRCASGLFSLVLIPAALSACGSGGKQPEAVATEERPLDIALSADADANIDIKGRGAPVMVRVYELQSDTAFLDADYFALQDQDRKTLGADLLAVDTFILRPGETRHMRRPAQAGTTHIAILAGYRDLPQASWRQVHPLAPAAVSHWYRALASARKIRLAVRLGAHGVTVTEPDKATQP